MRRGIEGPEGDKMNGGGEYEVVGGIYSSSAVWVSLGSFMSRKTEGLLSLLTRKGGS